MNTIQVKITKRKLSKLLSRMDMYFRDVQLDEQEYFMNYYLVPNLLPANNKIKSIVNIDDGIQITLKKYSDSKQIINWLENTKYIQDISNKLYYNTLVIYS